VLGFPVDFVQLDVTCSIRCVGKVEEPAAISARTINGIKNLAVGSAGTTLLNLGVVDLKEVVEPFEKVYP